MYIYKHVPAEHLYMYMYVQYTRMHVQCTHIVNIHVYISSVGRALCLEYRVSWVRVPPEAAHFFDYLGCAVLLCLVCLFDHR